MSSDSLNENKGPNSSVRVRIRNIRLEAVGINSYVLEALPGTTLPSFTPGAHIDVRITSDLVRSYSLVNDPYERDFYEIAVHYTESSRGGSRHIHENWRVGDCVEIVRISNNFPLIEDAPLTVLCAGGIGITPMLPMIDQLERLGRKWELHYVAASQDRAAYTKRVRRYPQAKVTFDGVPDGRRLDLESICQSAPEDAHLYCCGPSGMLKAFVELTRSRPSGHAHIEFFTADTEIAKDGGFTIELAKTGKSIRVNGGETILDSLLSAGVVVGFACCEGVCGSCQVGVLDGIPDHRDQFLSDREKELNSRIMVCCSGSKSLRLVLDL